MTTLNQLCTLKLCEQKKISLAGMKCKMLNRLRTALPEQNAEDCLTVLQRAVNGYSRWEPDADLVDDGG